MVGRLSLVRIIITCLGSKAPDRGDAARERCVICVCCEVVLAGSPVRPSIDSWFVDFSKVDFPKIMFEICQRLLISLLLNCWQVAQLGCRVVQNFSRSWARFAQGMSVRCQTRCEHPRNRVAITLPPPLQFSWRNWILAGKILQVGSCRSSFLVQVAS